MEDFSAYLGHPTVHEPTVITRVVLHGQVLVDGPEELGLLTQVALLRRGQQDALLTYVGARQHRVHQAQVVHVLLVALLVVIEVVGGEQLFDELHGEHLVCGVGGISLHLRGQSHQPREAPHALDEELCDLLSTCA